MKSELTNSFTSSRTVCRSSRSSCTISIGCDDWGRHREAGRATRKGECLQPMPMLSAPCTHQADARSKHDRFLAGRRLPRAAGRVFELPGQSGRAGLLGRDHCGRWCRPHACTHAPAPERVAHEHTAAALVDLILSAWHVDILHACTLGRGSTCVRAAWLQNGRVVSMFASHDCIA